MSKPLELMGMWRSGFSQTVPLWVCTCDVVSGSLLWTLAPRPQCALLDIRGGLPSSAGLWVQGVRIPPSWSRPDMRC